MDYLNNLFSLSPNLRCIDLENRDIKDVRTLMPLLAKFKYLEELELTSNNLTTLPKDLSCLSNLKSLNVSGNLFENFRVLVESLKTLPKLTKLDINLEDKDSVRLVLDSLPTLKLLNGQAIDNTPKEQAEPASPPRESPTKVSRVGTNNKGHAEHENEFKFELDTFNAIRNLRLVYEPDIKAKLNSDVSNKLADIKSELQQDLDTPNITENAKKTVMLKAKYTLLDLCFANMLEIQPDKETARIWQNIKTGHDRIVQSLIGLSLGTKPDLQRNLTWYKNELEKMKKEMAETLDMTQKLTEELQASTAEKEQMAQQFEKEKAEMLVHIQNLTGPRRNLVGSPEYNMSPLKPSNPSPGKTVGGSRDGTRGTNKSLSLKQLKEIIQDIFVQKRKYDAKCLENKMPKETMEQYMYTYLNQQYGLKSIILEWAKSILEGLARFSPYDTEVALFGKILRNECEEDFHDKLYEAKEGIIETLKEIARRKNKYMDESRVSDYVEELCKGPISEEIWKELVLKMVSEFDLEVVQAKILEKIMAANNSSQERSQVGDKRRMKREVRESERQDKKVEYKIEFVELESLLLEYTLAKHEIRIKRLVEIFRSVDEDSDGIINEKEFLRMIAIMNISTSDAVVNKLLSMLDPYKNQKITFSDTIYIFKMEQVSVDISEPNGKTTKKKLAMLDVLNI